MQHKHRKMGRNKNDLEVWPVEECDNIYHFLQFPRSSHEFMKASWQLDRGGQIILQMMKWALKTPNNLHKGTALANGGPQTIPFGLSSLFLFLMLWKMQELSLTKKPRILTTKHLNYRARSQTQENKGTLSRGWCRTWLPVLGGLAPKPRSPAPVFHAPHFKTQSEPPQSHHFLLFPLGSTWPFIGHFWIDFKEGKYCSVPCFWDGLMMSWASHKIGDVIQLKILPYHLH